MKILCVVTMLLVSPWIEAQGYKTAYDYAFCYEIADWVISRENACLANLDCTPSDKAAAGAINDRMQKIQDAVMRTVASRGISSKLFETAKQEKNLWIHNEDRTSTSFDMPAFNEWINTSVEVCARDFFVP